MEELLQLEQCSAEELQEIHTSGFDDQNSVLLAVVPTSEYGSVVSKTLALVLRMVEMEVKPKLEMAELKLEEVEGAKLDEVLEEEELEPELELEGKLQLGLELMEREEERAVELLWEMDVDVDVVALVVVENVEVETSELVENDLEEEKSDFSAPVEEGLQLELLGIAMPAVRMPPPQA